MPTSINSIVEPITLLGRRLRAALATNTGFYASSTVAAAALFAFDVSLPLGVASDMLYAALVLLGLWSPRKRYIIVLAAVASSLAVLGFYFSSEGAAPWIGEANVELALVLIWAAAVITYRYRCHRDQFDKKAALLTTTFATMDQGFCVYDAAGKLEAFNKPYEEMFNYPPGFLRIGLTHEEIIRFRAQAGHFGDGDVEQLVDDRLNYQYLNMKYSAENILPNGLDYLFVKKLMPDGGFVNTFTDITKRKRAERAAAEKSALLDTALQIMAQGFVVYGPDQEVVAYNEKFIEMSSLPADCQPMGMSHEETLRLRAKEGRTAEPLTEDIIQRRVQNSLDFSSSAKEHVRDDGTAFLFHRTPLPGGAGYVATYTDITDQKRAQVQVQEMNANLEEKVVERTAELQSAQEGLLRAERLATLGQLTGTVAHELRNPLGAVAVTARTIEQTIQDAGLDLSERFDRMNRGIRRCDNIITELLDFARAKGLEVEATPLDSWVSETLDEIAMPQGVTLHTAFDATGAVPDFDRDRLRRALINVVDNACQAMGDGGGELTVATRAEGARVKITIADNGPGIPEEALPKIFEPLFSTKQFGVGLGLPTVRQILEEHGGGFDISNQENGGARATLWLPLTSPAAGEARS